MGIVKNFIKRQLAQRGMEICQLYNNEHELLPPQHSYSFREAQAYLALANQGQLSLLESRLLGQLVRDSDPTRPIIEIGTLFGYSSIVMTLFKHPGQPLITVDNYCWNPLGLSPDAQYDTTRNRLKEATADFSVQVLRMDKEAFYRSYQGPAPAVFFCDADHSYEATKADILWARSVGASVICGDDYDHSFQRGTAQAVDELGGPARLAGGLFVM